MVLGDLGAGIRVSEGRGRWNWMNGVVLSAHTNQIPAGSGSSDALFLRNILIYSLRLLIGPRRAYAQRALSRVRLRNPLMKH